MEETEGNFEKFASKAVLARIISQSISTLFFSVIIFPLIIILPITLIAGAWYSREYIRKFIFRLNDTHIFVRKGVIIYSYTLIPYENVQDVHVVQDMTERLFGVWRVTIFTATISSRGAETIPCLDKEGAEKLKAVLFEKIKEAKHVTD